MSQHHGELGHNVRVIELNEEEVVPDRNEGKRRIEQRWYEFRKNCIANATASTIGLGGILLIPIVALIADDEYILEKLQANIETERAARGKSTVLAVDTSGLNVRSKSASPSTKELYEQVAMEHLARLHFTYSSWSERNQELMGSVLLKLMVDSTGTVVRVDPVDSHVTNSSFIKTVIDDVREWKFPKGSAESAEITVPLLFIPKSMDADMIVQWERKIRGMPQDETPAAPLHVAAQAPIAGASEKIPSLPPALHPTPHADHTTIARAAVIAAPKLKTEQKPLVVVKANRPLSIRDNPRFASNSVREVGEDARLSILESRGDWLKIRLADGGPIGFVRKEYVSPINGEP